MKRTLLAIIVIASLLLGACASRQAVNTDYYVAPSVGGAPVQPQEMRTSSDQSVAPSYDAQKSVEGNTANTVNSAVPPAAQDRLVIQNADMTLVVKDPKAKMDQMIALASRMGGFVVSSNMYQSYAPNGSPVPEGSVVIRVPAEKLDDALKEIKADAVDVQNENRSGQDVTQEYVDLKSRLKNLEAAEAQLTKIMEEATKTEDVLSVFNQLVSTREQIEMIKGQIQYYEQSATYSAISVRLVAEETIKPIEIGGWKPEGVARDAIQNLVNFLQGFVDFLINLVLFILPVLIVIGLFIAIPIWLFIVIVRAINRRMKKNKAAKETAPAEEQK